MLFCPFFNIIDCAFYRPLDITSLAKGSDPKIQRYCDSGQSDACYNGIHRYWNLYANITPLLKVSKQKQRFGNGWQCDLVL